MFELGLVTEAIVVCFCIGLSAYTQSTLGFGYAVLLVPLLTLFIDPKSAIALTQLVGLGVSAISYAEYTPRTKIRSIVPIALAATIATPLGAWVLLAGSEQTILICVGFGIAISAMGTLIRSKMSTDTHKETMKLQILAGTISGLLRGSVSMPGPPVIIYQHWIGGGAEQIRSRMFAYMIAMALPTTMILLIMGVFSWQIIYYAAPGLLAVFVGNYISQKTRDLMTEQIFKSLSIALLIVSATVLIIRGFTGAN